MPKKPAPADAPASDTPVQGAKTPAFSPRYSLGSASSNLGSVGHGCAKVGRFRRPPPGIRTQCPGSPARSPRPPRRWYRPQTSNLRHKARPRAPGKSPTTLPEQTPQNVRDQWLWPAGEAVRAIEWAQVGDPFGFLGQHRTEKGTLVRTFQPGAASVEAVARGRRQDPWSS